MPATTDQERGKAAVRDLMNMDDEHALILWRFGGFGTREDFPGARPAALAMLRGINRSGRKALAQAFASLAPHYGIRAVLALFRSLANPPAPIALPAPAPRAVAPQRRCHRLTPARAP